MPRSTDKAVSDHSLGSAQYQRKTYYVSVSHVVSSSKHLPRADETNCCGLNAFPRSYTYDYARGLKTLFVSLNVNQNGAKQSSAVQNVDGESFLNDVYLITKH